MFLVLLLFDLLRLESLRLEVSAEAWHLICTVDLVPNEIVIIVFSNKIIE